ncbi:Lrp/AsnC family transcriptional regulator [Candidatus Micrarchaeota archaeon]|nr:Lrp/AsnC family transcriptional regulator [Candidatus Micrarchaeota archaeon]MBU1166730.1 Lrp/AsnC family transcriptional regulator [Candidatus Micrarchaeota archaeon]MBU1886693.1 Lrp/AsnC family transcriptional regulator [Candidatus Micrarchaeota archaeon]
MKTKQIEIDKTDQQILSELKQDCRRSYRELATAIGMSPAALIERMKKLENNGTIRGYSANLDYLKLGFEFMAIIQISISGDMLKVQEGISKLRGVAAIYDTTGQYDSAAMAMCKSRQELSALVKGILKIPGVDKTNTSMVLNVVKKMDEFDGI